MTGPALSPQRLRPVRPVRGGARRACCPRSVRFPAPAAGAAGVGDPVRGRHRGRRHRVRPPQGLQRGRLVGVGARRANTRRRQQHERDRDRSGERPGGQRSRHPRRGRAGEPVGGGAAARGRAWSTPTTRAIRGCGPRRPRKPDRHHAATRPPTWCGSGRRRCGPSDAARAVPGATRQGRRRTRRDARPDRRTSSRTW